MDQDPGKRRKKRSEAEAEPVIPDKLYFRIGEAARLLSVAPYVLRFWESEFPQLHPNKGGTGQRLYRKRDVEMALRIKRLLYQEGYTIPGARQLLKAELRGAAEEKGAVVEDAAGPQDQPSAAEPAQTRLRRMRAELKEISSLLADPGPSRQTNNPLRAPAPGRRGLHLAARRNGDEKVTSALLFPVERASEES